jgi:hypothetical protein
LHQFEVIVIFGLAALFGDEFGEEGSVVGFVFLQHVVDDIIG